MEDSPYIKPNKPSGVDIVRFFQDVHCIFEGRTWRRRRRRTRTRTRTRRRPGMSGTRGVAWLFPGLGELTIVRWLSASVGHTSLFCAPRGTDIMQSVTDRNTISPSLHLLPSACLPAYPPFLQPHSSSSPSSSSSSTTTCSSSSSCSSSAFSLSSSP